MECGGISHLFYGTVLLCLADTLAAHQLGGFKVGVGFSLRICRDCMATREVCNIRTSIFQTSIIRILQLTEHTKSNSSTCKHEQVVRFFVSFSTIQYISYGVQLSEHFGLNTPRS